MASLEGTMRVLKNLAKAVNTKSKSASENDTNIPEHAYAIEAVFMAANNAVRFTYTLVINIKSNLTERSNGDNYLELLTRMHKNLVSIFNLLRTKESYYSKAMKTFLIRFLESVENASGKPSYMETVPAKICVLEYLVGFLTSLLPYRDIKRDIQMGDFYKYIHPILLSETYDTIALMIDALAIPPCCKNWENINIPVHRNQKENDRKNAFLMYVYYLLTRNVMLEERLSLSPLLGVRFLTQMPGNLKLLDSLVMLRGKMIVPNVSEIKWIIPDRKKYEQQKLTVEAIYLQAAIRDSLNILNEAMIVYRNFAAEHFILYPNDLHQSAYKHVLLTDFRRATFFGGNYTHKDLYDQIYHFNDELAPKMDGNTNIEDCLIWLSNIQQSVKMDLSATTDPKYIESVISTMRDTLQTLVVVTKNISKPTPYQELIQYLISLLPKETLLISTVKLKSLETSPLLQPRSSSPSLTKHKEKEKTKNIVTNFLTRSRTSSTSKPNDV